jgi:hypothetical protein
MKLLRTKIWCWYDIGLLKWSAMLFGVALGAFFADLFRSYVWIILLAAVLFAIRPTIAYYRD